MPLQFQPAEITLDGLDQKTAAPMRAPGKLEHAINVTYDKTGAIGKRLGYQRIDLDQAVTAFHSSDVVWCAVTSFRDELVVFSYDFVVAVGSRDANMRGSDTVTYRGPNNRGAGKLDFVSISRLSTVATEEA